MNIKHIKVPNLLFITAEAKDATNNVNPPYCM